MQAGIIALWILSSGAAAPLPASECEVAGSAPTLADSARARAACESARDRFAKLLGEPVPPVQIVFWDRDGYRTAVRGGRAVIYWPSDRVTAERAEGDAAAERYRTEQWRNVLPHEIAHTLLAARFFPDQHGTRDGGYGTPFPDWLDEGVAIWAESSENRRARLAQAHALPEARRDLRSILTTPHPAARDADILAMRDGAAPPPDEALRDFYPQAIAVLNFVYDIGGRAAVRALAGRLVDDPASLDALAGLPGLPADLHGVRTAWERWFAGDRESTDSM